MDTASFLDVFVAVMVANGLTVAALYCLWRMTKTDKDHRANLGWLTILAIVGLALWASTSG